MFPGEQNSQGIDSSPSRAREVPRHFLPLWPLVWLLCLLEGPLHAQVTPPSLNLIDLREGAVTSREELRGWARTAGTALNPQPLSPEMLDVLRWSVPDAARLTCPADVQVPGSRVSFSSLVQDAASQLQQLQPELAIGTLSQARAALPCAESRVLPADVSRLFLLEAAAHVYLRDNLHVPAFLNYLAVGGSDGNEQEADFPRRVRDALIEVERRAGQQEPFIVEASGYPGKVLIDGQPLQPGARVLPGWHVLQLERASGELRTTLVQLTAAAGTALELSSTVTFSMPSDAALRRVLSQAVVSGRLDAGLDAGLERWVQLQQVPGLALVAADAEGMPILRLYSVGAGLRLPGVEQSQALRRRSGVVGLLLEGGTGLTRGAGEGQLTAGGATLRLGAFPGRRLRPAVLLELQNGRQVIDTTAISPVLWQVGAQLAYAVPLFGTLEFRPSVGVVYGQGTPALLSNCQLDVSAGVESVRCGDSATEGEAVDVLVPVRGVGGLARLELRWARLPGDWGLVGGIQGSYLSTGFSSAHQGSFAADPAQTGVPIVVDARLRTSSLGLLISLGAEKCF